MLLSSLSRQDVPHGPHWCRAFLLLCTIFWNLLGISAFRPSSGLRIQKAEYLRPGPQRVAYSARAHARLGLLFAQPRPPQRPRPPRAAPAMAASADAPAGAEAGQRGRGLHSLLGPAAAQKFAFFGGKGGVGKTSASAAAAVRLADAGYATLVLSTDPAHSLGDALGQSLAGGRVERVAGAGEGGGGEGGLWALEVDAARAVAEFQEVVAGVDLVAAARSVGLPEDIIQQLGLKEMVGVLRNPPPGLDELVALAKVVRLARGEAGGAQDAAEAGALGGRRFDRIVIDTAPTGHTLRLLAFPDFLDGFLGKVIELRAKVDGALRALKGLGLFSDGGQGMVAKTEAALLALERYRAEMLALRELFRDPESTEFVVVTIPTQLAVAESVRLVGALVDEGIAVRTLVANRLVDPAAEDAYLARLAATQRQGVAQVEAWRDAQHPDLSITKVPYFDLEVVGPAALQFLGSQAYNHAPGGDWAELFQEREGKGEEGEGEARFVIFGGKGGVGKTSSSAALAASFAAEGLETVVVSTDPAHSLGDALQADLSSGELVPIEGVYGTGGGAPAGLWALEVDPAAALGEFKAAVGGWAQDDSALLRQFSSFADVLDTAPPGTDELVALAKVLDLVKGDGEGGGRPRFDRVVIDTAPTGHTLRLLAFPDFLGDFFERLIRIRDRLKKTSAVFNAVSSVMSNDAAFKKDAVANAKDRLRAFQFQMFELEELFRDEERAEFVVVTIPTALALAESQRLVAQLKEEDIAVRRLVLNQLLDGTGKEGGEGDEAAATERRRAYFRRLAQGQEVELKRLEGLQRAAAEAGGEGLALVRVPYFDAELTGVPGLRAMAQVLFAEGGSGGQ